MSESLIVWRHLDLLCLIGFGGNTIQWFKIVHFLCFCILMFIPSDKKEAAHSAAVAGRDDRTSYSSVSHPDIVCDFGLHRSTCVKAFSLALQVFLFVFLLIMQMLTTVKGMYPRESIEFNLFPCRLKFWLFWIILRTVM